MLGLFTRRSRRSPAVQPARSRPWLESLEARDCPSAIPPTSITLNVSYGTGHQVTLSGKVTDGQPGNLTVVLGGVVNGTATTDTQGYYSATLTASSLGSVTASVVDNAQHEADASAQVSNAAPVISNFTAVAGPGNVWTFTGQVADEHPGGLVVNFSQSAPESLESQSVTVANDGTFTLVVQMQQNVNDSGLAVAQVASDWWGTSSNSAVTNVSQT